MTNANLNDFGSCAVGVSAISQSFALFEGDEEREALRLFRTACSVPTKTTDAPIAQFRTMTPVCFCTSSNCLLPVQAKSQLRATLFT